MSLSPAAGSGPRFERSSSPGTAAAKIRRGSISADRGGIAAGNASIDRHKGLSDIEAALLIAIAIGGLLLAFAGTRITAQNGVGVGGTVEDSTISIERGGSTEP